MVAALPTDRVPSARLAADELFQLVERILLAGDLPIDRSGIRRGLQEAMESQPGPPAEMWWIWVTETAAQLGLRCRCIEVRSDELVEFAACGGPFIVWLPRTAQFCAMTQLKRRRFQIVLTGPDGEPRELGQKDLAQLLQQDPADSVVRAVVFEGTSTAVFQESSQPGSSPWQRLKLLLRPEWSDIWVVLVFAVVNGLLALASPIAVEALVNTVALGQLLQPLLVLSLFLFVFLSFSAALKALQTVVVENIQRRLFARVAGDLAYRLPRVIPSAGGHYDLPEMVNRFFEVVTVQKVCSGLLLDGISLVIGALVGMVVLAFYHPWLLSIDLVLVALMAFAFWGLGKGAVSTSILESKKKYAMAAWLEDLASCEHAFRFAGAADFALDRADRLTYDYLDARRKHFRVLIRQVTFTLFLQAIASTVLLGVGGWLVMQGQLTLGQLVAAELIVAVIVGAFAKFGKHMEGLYDLLASVDKLGGLFDLPMHRQEGLMSFPEHGPACVEINRASYAREHGDSLAPLTFRISAGDRIAVTGPSGSGKSTLLDLLCGRLAPTSGRVTIDGFDPLDLRAEVLQQHVACVENAEVFSGTVAENVHMGRADVTVHDVRRALHQVGMLDPILRLPDGLETHLTRLGAPLTDSQKRRLTLARAIVAGPRLLLVDGLLDGFPDEEAHTLATELCSRRHPWTLVAVTGRRSLTPVFDKVLDLTTDSDSR